MPVKLTEILILIMIVFGTSNTTTPVPTNNTTSRTSIPSNEAPRPSNATHFNMPSATNSTSSTDGLCNVTELELESGDATYCDWSKRILFDNCYKNPNENGSCPYEDITFWLYTRQDPHGIQITMHDLQNLPVDTCQPWKVIFHGFKASKESPGRELKKAYLSRGRYNILVADYTKPMSGDMVCYLHNKDANTALVAKCSADFLIKMMNARVLPRPSKLHLIGHSLGAHIAADISIRLRKRMAEKVNRITGLDPAGVLIHGFFSSSENHRLEPTDAQFVDAHHTNNGVLAAGIWHNVGTVDIWYNFGWISYVKQVQPGCYDGIFSMDTDECSHHRAIEYFAESIKPLPPSYDQFNGADTEEEHQYLVGEDIARDGNSPKGELYVETHSMSPFAQGPIQLGRNGTHKNGKRRLPNVSLTTKPSHDAKNRCLLLA